MLSNNQEFVYCSEHNQMIHKDNAKLLMQAAIEREQNDQNEVQQLDTLIAFSSGVEAPSYLPKKNVLQAGFSEKPALKNSNILPTMTETFLEFAGWR